MSGRPSVSGDINGDEYDDFLVGAPDGIGGGYQSGQVYLLFGKDSGWQIELTLDHADASIIGQEWNEIGQSPTGAGDVNADGYDDFLFGGVAGVNLPEIYLVLGRETGWQLSAPLDSVDASILGDAANEWLIVPSGGGDLDGDGFDDFLITSESNDEGGANAGKVFLFFGKDSGWFRGAGLDSSGASFVGEAAYDNAGTTTAIGGDINGDGYDDALIGAWGNDEAGELAGKAYLVFGSDTGWTQDTDLGSIAASFVGERPVQGIGSPVAIADDVNGDGYDDMLFGSLSDDEVGSNAGQVYLVFGKAAGWGPSTSMAFADASFLGENAGDFAGSHVSKGGDINGDGFHDLLIAASFHSYFYQDAGKAYFVYGKDAGWAMDTPLSSADGMMWGEATDDAFGQGSGGGDVNGDGYDDFVLNSLFNDDNASRAGKTYLYLGGSWDEDLDGWMVNQGDCDDSDATVFPGSLELCDGLDNDCDGVEDDDTDVDLDGDGFTACEGDCQPLDSDFYPGAPELCDGLDNDCDGDVPQDEIQDLDFDGWTVCDGDCDDGDYYVHPGADDDNCDGNDSDCDGTTSADEQDADADGWLPCEGDCDDSEATVHPEADELCDGIDNDCDSLIPADELDDDGDGEAPCAGDCDDGDVSIHATAPEVCDDGLDNDCDGFLDGDDPDCPGPSDDDDGTGCECSERTSPGTGDSLTGWDVPFALALAVLIRRSRR